MQRRPFLLACHVRTLTDHKCILAVVDSANSLQLHEIEVFSDSVSNPKSVRLNNRPLQTFTLSPPMHSPLALVVCPMRREATLRSHAGRLPQLLILQRNHELLLLDLNEAAFDGTPYPFAAIRVSSDRVHSCWLDVSVTYAVQECCVVIAFGNEGVHAHCLPAALVESPSQKSLRRSARPLGFEATAVAAGATISTHLAEFDVEALPIGVLPLDGFLVFAMEGLFRKFVVPGLYPAYQVNCRPVLYQHRLLLPLVSAQSSSSGEMDVAVVDDPLARILHRLRETGSFVDTMDYLLHSIIDNELDSRHVAHDRRRALQFIISVLRRYPEFHQIIVGCVRKIDVVKWRVVFDVIGKPMDFFNDCIANRRIIEAAHVVRVVMMDDSQEATPGQHALPASSTAAGQHGTPLRRTGSAEIGGALSAGEFQQQQQMLAPLEDATNCARRLFTIVLSGGDFNLAFELLRFMTLLSLEIDLPNNDRASTTISVIERALRSMWRGGQPKPAPAPAPSLATAVSGIFRSAGPSAPMAGTGESAGLLRPCEPSAEHSVGNMLRKYPSLRVDMETTAVSLLRIGKVAQLCAMFEAFQLDLNHFISTALAGQHVVAAPQLQRRGSSSNAHVDCSSDSFCSPMSLNLREIFSNIHAEFGLPRCPQGEIAIPPSLMQHPLAANSLRLFTATQEHLATVTASCDALNNIACLFSRHSCVEYQCAFSILLIQVDALKRLVVEHASLVSEQVIHLLREKDNAGYHRMLEVCAKASSEGV